MKKYKETAQEKTARISPDTRSTPRRRSRTSAAGRPARRIFAGDGWTAAVALDDAFAPELLQTWSLPDEDEPGPATDLSSLTYSNHR